MGGQYIIYYGTKQSLEIPSILQYQVTSFRIVLDDRQSSLLCHFIPPLFTRAWLGLAWTTEDLISYHVTLFSVVGGIEYCQC